MKKWIIILIVIFLVLLALVIIRGDEDTWLCQNGQWVKHGNPQAPKPKEICGSIEDKIKVSKPQEGDSINNPLEIQGETRGFWFFEASFPIEILDKNGNRIATGIGRAQSDWMTDKFVSFKASLDFITLPQTKEGEIIFRKDNPSGLPENDEEFRMPIKFGKIETTKIKVYFNNSNLDQEVSCQKVFPIEKEILKTQAVARAALAELLKGPTEEEKTRGYFTSINSGVEIKNLNIDNGTARVDFNQQLENWVGGSCRVAAIRSQIIETLKQFSTVKDVVISIDGRVDDILQP